MRHKGMEYPELKGKTIRRVWFKDDDEFTALFLEFEDNTRARFDLRAAVTFALLAIQSMLWFSYSDVRKRPVVTVWTDRT